MNPSVDFILKTGCGRCKFHATPACKIHKWHEELTILRHLLLQYGLNEEVKWGFPCYTLAGKNIVMLAAFKDNCALSFFKGALLKENPILEKSGENSVTFRLIRFQGVEKINQNLSLIQEIILEAIEIEKQGKKLPKMDHTKLEFPEELQEIFDEDFLFKEAFNRLTPGRQRGYILFFSQPKQSQTRMNRIQKYYQLIIDGKGMND
jgi:uncharacterized protein YdeI (YjbR/CyaY-like superfamily)